MRQPHSQLELGVEVIEAVVPNVPQHMLALGNLANNQFVSVHCEESGVEMQ